MICNGCWGARGRGTPSENEDDNELADAIESVAAVGIGVALGGDPVTEIAVEVVTRVAAPVVEEIVESILDVFD